MIETLVVIAILGVLASILIPALRSARAQMKTLMCQSNLRTVALKFHLFAEGLNEEGKGASETLGGKQFWIDDFQSLLYGTGSFWNATGQTSVMMRTGEQLMMCPAGAPTLTKYSGKPFGAQSVGPAERVTIGMNARLYRAETVNALGKYVLASRDATRIGPEVLSHPYAPLAFDIDGVEAKSRGVDPFYSAPPSRVADSPYASGRTWIPSKRHRGGMNVAFVGGHVFSSDRPSREPWDWEYQPQVTR